MTTRIGIVIEQEAVRAVLVSGSEIVATWKAERGETALARHIEQMLAAFPRSRWMRPKVRVAVGSRACQTKRLTGLPALHDRNEVERLVRESSTRFFVGDAALRLVAAVPADGAVLAAAFDRLLVDEIIRAAGRERVRSLEIVAAASVSNFVGNRLALPKDVGEEFVAAYATATLANPLNVPALRLGKSSGAVPRWRAVLATLALVAASALLAVTPALSARRSAAVAAVELRDLDANYRTVLATQRTLTGVSQSLSAVSRFQRERRLSAVLEGLSRTIPRHTALIALAVDSTGGSLVAVSEAITEVLGALERLPLIASPQLSGPITRERFAEKELDRATIRFVWGSTND